MSNLNGNNPAALLGRTVLTTGQIAKICGVSPRTASKWCDDGRLKHYRIPGSQDRRVTRAALEQFLKDNDLPFVPPVTGALLIGYSRPPAGWAGATCAADTFSAGLLLAAWVPAVIVVNVWALGDGAADSMATVIRAGGKWSRSRLVALLPDDRAGEDTKVLKSAGYTDVLWGEDGLCEARLMAQEG